MHLLQFTENYTISKCGNAMQNVYYAHWGKDSEIFELLQKLEI